EHPADNGRDDLRLGDDGDVSDEATKRKRAGVAHEDRGGRTVEPQEAEAGAENGAAQHRELAGAEHEIDLQIFGEVRIADRPGNRPEAAGRDHDRSDSKAIEAVSEIHGVAGADYDERAEDDEEP